MTSQVQLYSTPLSILSIPAEHYQPFFHGIVKLVTNTWEEDYRPALSTTSSSIFKSNERSSHTPRPYSTSTDSPAISRTDSEGSLSSSTNRLSARSLDDYSNNTNNVSSEDFEDTSISDQIDALQEFINISFTPVECSVICPTELVDLLFGKALDQAALSSASGGPKVLLGQYLAIQIDGDGANSGSRILDITAPLSSAGIPIFFIPTYFSDYVLVPSQAQSSVSTALESRGFVFSNTANSYVSASPSIHPMSSDFKLDQVVFEAPDQSATPLSPYLASLGDQTFDRFLSNGVRPVIDVNTKLLLTGARTQGRSINRYSSSSLHACLYLTIVEILIHPPDYFSVTVTGGSEVSFIINQDMVEAFPSELLLGSPTDFVIPISFDLSSLPEDSTGIVAGVASRLLKKSPGELMQMSYLSTAKTGVVMIPVDDIDLAKDALSGYL